MPIQDRSRSPAGESSKEPSSDIQAAFAKMFELEKDNFTSDITKSVSESVCSRIQSMCTTVCTDAIAPVVSKVGALEGEVAEIKQTLQDISDKLSHQNRGLDVGDGVFGETQAESPATAPALSGFNRALDPTVLYSNTKGNIKISRALFYKDIVRLAGEANIPESVIELVGDPLDNRFDIRFKGLSPKATCTQFYQSMQLGRGRWKPQQIPNEQGQPVQHYVQPDRNASMVRREVQSKLLCDYLKEIAPTHTDKFFLRKAVGTILVDRKPLIAVHVLSETSSRLALDHARLPSFGLQSEIIEQHFNTLCSAGQGALPL